jgi:hypothetical protein
VFHYQNAVEDEQAGEETDCLSCRDLEVTILRIYQHKTHLNKQPIFTLPTTTAAQIMLARPNSVEDTPAI